MNIIETLRSLRACDAGIADVSTLHALSPADAWAQCQHAQHMLWLLGEVGADRRVIVSIACDIAETALVHVPAGEDRPRIAIETARRWARGEATLEEVQTARSRAWSAADATAVAALVAAPVAATTAAYDAAAAAATAAATTAYAAATTAAYAAATRAQHTDIIRAHVSYADLEPLLAARLARVAA